MRSLDDCYRALGLKPGSSDAEIRRAYKALVLKFHPDRGEGSDAARFRELQEANEILTSPEKCAELRQRDRREASHHRDVRRGARAGVVEDWLSEDLVEELVRDLFGWRSPNYRIMGGTLEITMTPFEAARGGKIPLRVPLNYPCPECGGTGGYFCFACPRCGGAGSQQIYQQITLDLPADSISFGGREMYLRDRRFPGGGLRIVLRIEG